MLYSIPKLKYYHLFIYFANNMQITLNFFIYKLRITTASIDTYVKLIKLCMNIFLLDSKSERSTIGTVSLER